MTSAEFIEAVLNGYQSLLIACLPIVFYRSPAHHRTPICRTAQNKKDYHDKSEDQKSQTLTHLWDYVTL